MSTSRVCAFTGSTGWLRSTPAIAHRLRFFGLVTSGLHTDTNGADGSLGAKMRMLTTALHSIVTSEHVIAFVPVELVHDCTSPVVTENLSVNGGGSPHAASTTMASNRFIATAIRCSGYRGG